MAQVLFQEGYRGGKRRKAPQTVLTRMHKFTDGPLSVLYKAFTEGKRVTVWIRSLSHIRGICSGNLLVYDTHLNIVLSDVLEQYTQPRTLQPTRTQKRRMQRQRKQKQEAEVDERTVGQLQTDEQSSNTPRTEHRSSWSSREINAPGEETLRADDLRRRLAQKSLVRNSSADTRARGVYPERMSRESARERITELQTERRSRTTDRGTHRQSAGVHTDFSSLTLTETRRTDRRCSPVHRSRTADGRIDQRTDSRTTDRRIDRREDWRKTDGRTDRRTDSRTTDGRTDRREDWRTADERIDRREDWRTADGLIDLRADRRTADERIDRREDRRTSQTGSSYVNRHRNDVTSMRSRDERSSERKETSGRTDPAGGCDSVVAARLGPWDETRPDGLLRRHHVLYETKQRRIKQLFIRGDNVVMIALAPE